MRGLYAGCMRGRTMYVIPFVMGHLEAEKPMFGVEITDSAYVTASHARDGPHGQPRAAPDGGARRRRSCPRCTRSACRSRTARPTSPWPCNDTKYIVQFPEERAIWSFGSGLRRQRAAGQEVLRPAHRQRDGPRRGLARRAHADPQADQPRRASRKYVAAAFPSACGKTNLAMLAPTIPGWKVETIGDDIAWMRIGEDGRLWAVNPEYGFFGVAPGTNEHTNPNAMRTINKGNSVFTNVALTDDGDIWWEGMENTPAHATSWKGEDWTPDSDELSSHPNSRYCTPIKQCPILAPRVRRPARRADRRDPLRRSPQDHRSRWSPRPATGCTAPSWARRSPRRPPPPRSAQVGVVRRDPMAMLPFIGYNAGDYFNHWIDDRQGQRRGQAAEDLLRQLVPSRRRRRLPVARASARTAACSSGSSSASRARPPRSRPRSATCRRPARSTSTGST